MNTQPSTTTPKLEHNPLYKDPQVQSDIQRGEELAANLLKCASQQATPEVRALLNQYAELKVVCETLRLKKHDGVPMCWYYARLVKRLG